MKKHIFSLLVATCLLSINVDAQPTKTLEIGHVHTLHSTILHEDRIINVYLPKSYKEDTALYPILYLLDGSANEDFIHVTGLVQFLTMIEAMPPTIVVGIANIDRKRDFTFPTTVSKDKLDFPTSGGSASFIRFIQAELIPFIDNQYRTNANTTLLGQSLGGLLATEILLQHDQLFNNYIIVSPSLWWDKQSLLPVSGKHLKYNMLHKVYMAVGGKEDLIMRQDAKKIKEIYGKETLMNFAFRYEILPEESHLTILHNAAYKALVWLNAKK